MKITIFISALIAFAMPLVSEEMSDTLEFEDLFCDSLLDPFCDERTILTIEERKTKDEFGEDIKKIHAYFISDGIKYTVESTDYSCIKNKEEEFPFEISARFPKPLDYDIDRSSSFFAHILLRYRLMDNSDDTFAQNNVFHLFEGGRTLKTEKLKDFWLGGGRGSNLSPYSSWGDPEKYMNPLNRNLYLYRKAFKGIMIDAGGKLIVNIPIMGSDEVYRLSINPFHESWLELYYHQCPPAIDTSAADSIDFEF